MKQTIEQLERVRSRAKFWLLSMRVGRWLAGVIVALLVMGLADWLLRLPGGVRAVIGLGFVAVAGYYAITRIGKAARIQPALTSIALRLERLTPAARGRIASAVAFATNGSGDDSPVANAMARQTADEGEGVVDDKQVGALLDKTRPVRAIALMLVMVAAMVGVATAAPASFNTAVSRWVNPFGDAEWPNRYNIESMLTREVAANNAPIRLEAHVTKGDRESLRATAWYRFYKNGEPVGQWQPALMTRQKSKAEGVGEYQRLLEPDTTADEVRVYFESGDDATAEQSVMLIEPPTLTELIAEVTPPAYAKEFIPTERHDLLKSATTNIAVNALEGSRITLRVKVRGSFDPLAGEANTAEVHAWVREAMVGLLDAPAEGQPGARNLAYELAESNGVDAFTLGFDLIDAVQFRFSLEDQFNTRYEDQRLFGIDAREDAQPRATVFEPGSDQQVTAKATIALAAEAHDDVAVKRLALTTAVNGNDPTELASDEPAQPTARLREDLDLAPLDLKPGDEVAVAALVRDNFLLDGREHDPVRSTARIIRIISEEDLVTQARLELAEIRSRAIRARAQQTQINEDTAKAERASAGLAEQQRQLAERVGAMKRSMQALKDRLDKNKLDDEAIRDLIDDAGELTEKAANEATAAATQLDRSAKASSQAQQQQGGEQQPGEQPKPQPNAQQAEQLQKQAEAAQKQAQSNQQQAKAELSKLVDLLDQGKDAYELRQKLQSLKADQEALSQKTRDKLPETLGKSDDQLTPKQKQDLKDIAKEQKDLADRAKDLQQRMQSTAAAMARQSQKPENQAAAKAMQNAAQKAAEKGLQQKMQQAGDQAEQNQLAQAQGKQSEAEQILDEMLKELDKTEQLKAEILRRKLNELVDAIRKLKERQEAQLARLGATDDGAVGPLDQPQVILRRNTLDVSTEARETSEETIPVAEHLDAAADDQGGAIESMRLKPASKPNAVLGQNNAVAHLADALKLAEELAAKANDEMTEDERKKLMAEYAKVLKRQLALNEATDVKAIVKDADRGRVWRKAVIELGDEQNEIRDELAAIGGKVSDTVVFADAHRQLADWTERITRDLHDADPSADAIFEQQMVASTIAALIEALRPEPPSDEFIENEQEGGGGGDGPPGPQPLVPPIAELKMLKGRQIIVKDLTVKVDGNEALGERLINRVAGEQNDLAGVGQKLLDALSQQGGGGGPAPLQPGGGGEPEGPGESPFEEGHAPGDDAPDAPAPEGPATPEPAE